MRKRAWRRFYKRALVAAFIAFAVAVASLPMWMPEWFHHWQVPIVIFLFICYIGKLLIDTIEYPSKK
jgi:hypothetical protein